MKKYGKYTLLGWGWRILVWMALTPILLMLLLCVLIYLPPVQKYAVDKTAEILSEEMDMDVTVGGVYLRFPLDLTISDMRALQDGDTIVDVRRLDISVKARPLLDSKVEVDGIRLSDAKLNTKELIEAVSIRGTLKELSLDSHSTDLKQELAVVNKALVCGADLVVLLADSVSADTTESAPVNWRVRLDDVRLHDVKAQVRLAPSADSTWVMAHVSDAFATGLLDLGREEYAIHKLIVDKTSASFDLMSQPRLSGQLDPSHLSFHDIGVEVDTFIYKGTGEMSLNLTHLEAREASGLVLADVHGPVLMDSLSLHLPRLEVTTADSKLALAYSMDMNTFDEHSPGSLSLVAEGQLGKDDIIYFTRMGGEATTDVCTMMAQTLPSLPTQLQLKAKGNMQALDVSRIYLRVPELAVAEGEAQLFDLVGDMALQTTIDLYDHYGASVLAEAKMSMGSETYNAQLSIDSLVVNNYMPMEQKAAFTGQITASGRGFDIYSPHTTIKAAANIFSGCFGKINLSNIAADVSMEGHQVDVTMAADNEQLKTHFNLVAELQRKLVSGYLNIDLPFIDAKSMGFSDQRLELTTAGNAMFSYDWKELFRIDSHVESLNLFIGKDSLSTDVFDLYAEAKKDTTAATFNTGDFSLSFFTPNNLFKLLPKVEKLQKETVRQFTNHEVNLDVLRTYLPEVLFHVHAGKNNPVADVLKVYDMHFDELSADISISPEEGVISNAHVYSFSKEGVMVDTVYMVLDQDSTQLGYNIGVRCHQQPSLPAFKANLEGYVMAAKADAHFTFFDKRGTKGVDLGVRVQATDTCLNFRLYPDKPVIAFREFALNDDNYIVTYPNRPVSADVRLASTSDNCYFSVFAEENEFGRQIANVVVTDLDIKQLLTVVPVPGLPSLGGLFNMDAYYIDQEDNFLVDGTVGANAFTYEGSRVGDISSRFTYTPRGENAHDVDANFSLNDVEVLTLEGEYDASGNGALDADIDFIDMPMNMLSPFIPDKVVSFSGNLGGCLRVNGPMDALIFNGGLLPKDMHVISDMYSLDLALANDSIPFNDSRVDFNNFTFHSAGSNPLALNGYVDFANFEKLHMALSLRGSNFKLVSSPRAANKVLFGDMYGDFFARVIGSTDDMTVRGLVRVLPTTDITYVMAETPLYQGDRLEDIVTFVDFKAPPPPKEDIVQKTFMGMDMNVMLSIEDGAELHGEFSADRQSYVNVQGGGTITMTYTPEGVLNLQGRYTINEGEMKYTLPVIPLKTFTIHNGSYIEFTGDPMNPILNVAATERVKAQVGQSDGATRSVAFDTGLKITNSLNNMGLAFTIEAPEDMTVQNELAACSDEEKNKLAVAMLATGMYLSGTNSKGFSASNALNNFLQNEINNIAGRALSTMVDVNVGMEQTTRDDGSRRTDYSFRFSRHFFSDRLNVVIGGKVSSDGDPNRNESGAYIDDISLEWRLDNGNTQYIKVFHEKDYSNLIEGELDKNGVGILLRKKVDKFSDLFIWRKKKNENTPASEEKKAEQPADVKKDEGKPTDVKKDEGQPADVKKDEGRPADVKKDEDKPADMKISN